MILNVGGPLARAIKLLEVVKGLKAPGVPNPSNAGPMRAVGFVLPADRVVGCSLGHGPGLYTSISPLELTR